jgi:hypothetical protein
MPTRFLLCMLLMVGGAYAQESNFASGPQYLMNSVSPLFARPIATPSLSFDTPSLFTRPGTGEYGGSASSEQEPLATVSELQGQADLFPLYYGVPRVSVINLSFRESRGGRPQSGLPAGFVEPGVVELTDVASLRLRGYGVTLPEAAAYWKGRHESLPHVYTNKDIEDLRSQK